MYLTDIHYNSVMYGITCNVYIYIYIFLFLFHRDFF